MKRKRTGWMVWLAVLLLLGGSTQANAFRGRGNDGMPGAQQPHPAGTVTDGTYLYVMGPGLLVQYALSDLSLVNQIELPKPEQQETSEEEADLSSETPPPRGPSGLSATSDHLYLIVAGTVYTYEIPALTLVASGELPRPEPLEEN